MHTKERLCSEANTLPLLHFDRLNQDPSQIWSLTAGLVLGQVSRVNPIRSSESKEDVYTAEG